MDDFFCEGCNLRHLITEAVDVSGVVGVGGPYACGVCAEKIFDADDEDRMVLESARKAAEARVCGGLSESGLYLLGEEMEAL